METSSHPPAEAILRYLELLQDAAVRATHTAGRLFVVRVTLTLALLALALGVVDTEEQVELSGLHFEMKLWVLLVAMSILGLALLVFDVAHYLRGHRLAWRAVQLYAELGFEAPRREWNSRDSPFGLQYAAAAHQDPLWSRWWTYRRVAVAGTTLATVLLVIAQIIVAARVIKESGWSFWPCAFLIIPVATASLGVGRVIAYRRAAEEHL
jgi:hypothetical protein